jgi:hypothetical protein
MVQKFGGFEDIQIMEKIHLKFCKRILNARLTTPNYMVYGELGRYPLEIRVNLRMVSILINESYFSLINWISISQIQIQI